MPLVKVLGPIHGTTPLGGAISSGPPLHLLDRSAFWLFPDPPKELLSVCTLFERQTSLLDPSLPVKGFGVGTVCIHTRIRFAPPSSRGRSVERSRTIHAPQMGVKDRCATCHIHLCDPHRNSGSSGQIRHEDRPFSRSGSPCPPVPSAACRLYNGCVRRHRTRRQKGPL